MKMSFPKQLSLFLTLFLSVSLFSFKALPDKANFSGAWKLNEGKSDLGNFGRFAARTVKVDQKGDAITISKTAPSFQGDDVTTTETLGFDGKESESTVFGTAKKKSTVKWSDDNTMVITYTILFERDGQTTEIKGTETWTVTKEGALSIVTNSSSPRGESTTKAIYEK